MAEVGTHENVAGSLTKYVGKNVRSMHVAAAGQQGHGPTDRPPRSGSIGSPDVRGAGGAAPQRPAGGR